MTRKATKSLTPQQQRAVELLLSGATKTATAAAIEVSRETVHRWCRENFRFIAAMNRAQRELRDAASARLFATWGKAVENVALAVEKGDLKVSQFVIERLAGVLDTPPAFGPDDPEELAEDAARQAESDKQLAALDQAVSDSLKSFASPLGRR